MLLAETLRSSTLKLALICIGIFGAAVLGLFGYVYWSTASFVLSRADQAIAVEHADLRRIYDSAGRGGLAAIIEQRLAAPRLEDRVYLLADPSLTPIAGNLAAWPAALKGADGWDTFTAPDWRPDAAGRSMLRAQFATLPNGEHLLTGRDIGDLEGFARSINTALALGISLIFVLAGVASVSVTRRTVGRIESINATSRAIMRSGLGERIPLRGSQDEWDKLAENLNLMLDRIEALMGEVKQVSDSVAHDLRTPLTRMRGRLEKASGRQRSADEDRALINDTMADLDGVLRMFTSLTRISQIETTDRMAAFRTVNLAEIAAEVVELFDAAAEDRGVTLATAGDQRVLVTGDRDLLFDAMANLVDNAIKHGRDAGRVTVTVAAREPGAVMSVADDGPGIPAHEMQHVFKRFYRLERSRCTPGNGLGLSLVAAVARLHGARIALHDNAPGLEFRLEFPPAAAASTEAKEPPLSASPESARI
ncbi:MAG TPA: HAMP domain-containing sensor histidine kinase [Xanthobacteraceae bacterium]|nr:HAMP domain-containing sensor histidine kinase [Xanthobacteraceae bacterium]